MSKKDINSVSSFLSCNFSLDDLDSLIQSFESVQTAQLIRDATYTTAKKFQGFVEQSLHKEWPTAYNSIMAGTSKSHPKLGSGRHQGINVWQSDNVRALSAIVSISPAHADYRLHWLESGAGMKKPRITGKVRGMRKRKKDGTKYIVNYQWKRGKKDFSCSVQQSDHGSYQGRFFLKKAEQSNETALANIMKKELSEIFEQN